MKALYLSLVVCMFLRAQPAWADKPPPSRTELAREHFQKGVAFYKVSSFDAALAEFERAYEVAPSYRLLYNIAQVQVERHDYVDAVKRFEAYLYEGGSELSAERQAEIESELRELSRLVAQLFVVANVADAELLIDGDRVATLPLPVAVPVNAGVHRVLLRKVGYGSLQQEVTLVGGEERRLELSLTPEASTASPQRSSRRNAAKQTPHASPSRAPVWISLSLGVALGATATAFALETEQWKGRFQKDLATFPGDGAQLENDRSKLRLYAGLTDGFAAGSLLACGFFGYFLLSADSSRAATNVPRARRIGLRVGPAGASLLGDL